MRCGRAPYRRVEHHATPRPPGAQPEFDLERSKGVERAGRVQLETGDPGDDEADAAEPRKMEAFAEGGP